MDLVTGLSVFIGFDAILNLVDKFSKRMKYAAVHVKDDACTKAKVFFDAVVRHHGLPEVIISGRDSKFTSMFRKSLLTIIGVRISMTTAYRAQADGQTERQNLVVEDALKCKVSYHGTDWTEYLGSMQYAHSTLVSVSTGYSPFKIDTGRKERSA